MCSILLFDLIVVHRLIVDPLPLNVVLCRYGFRGCGHLTCDYMLSYHVINTTDVDMEISARGTGWVAVGFSSDKFMVRLTDKSGNEFH